MKKLAFLGMAAMTAAMTMGMALPEGAKMPDGLKGIMTGVLGGVLAVFLGWGKNKNAQTGEMEKFDVKYAWPTLIIGAIVGLIAHFMKLTPEGLVGSLEASPLFAGAVLGLEALWKIVFRHSVPLIRETVNSIKGGGNPPSPPSQ
jgi:hypothetical protein